MISINLENNIDEVSKRLIKDFPRQLRKVIHPTINDTLFYTRKKLQEEIVDSFDNPTPYIKRSPRVIKADSQSLSGVVHIEDAPNKGNAPSKILQAEVFGGPRRHKKFEKALIYAGIMPADMFAVPGAAADLDQYGNIKGSQIVKILSYFRAFPEHGYRANSTAATRKRLKRGSKKKYGVLYFAGKPNKNLPDGVWMREIHGLGARIRPILIFVKRPQYQVAFDFFFTAEHYVRANIQRNFNWNLRKYYG